MNNSAAPIAPDPEIRTTASKLTAITTMIAANRETVETRSRIGRSLSATIGLLAFSISPPASGSSISRVRNRAIRSESTCAPTTTCGWATGKYIVVPTISRTTNPADNAASPFAIQATFGMNGAPAESPRTSKPVARGAARSNSRPTPTANNGTMMKLVIAADNTSGQARSPTCSRRETDRSATAPAGPGFQSLVRLHRYCLTPAAPCPRRSGSTVKSYRMPDNSRCVRPGSSAATRCSA